ncbi:MAG: VapE domain-containing protein [Gemmatimonadota bacterium]
MLVDESELQQHIDHGMPLLKLKKREKSPSEAGWRKRNYTLGSIRVHVRKHGNIGVAIPEGVVVMDVDPKHADARGRSAAEIVSAVELEYGFDLSAFPTVETGSGGLHIYMIYDPGLKLREKIKVFGGAVEFKKHGKLMVAAGSIHPNGNYYRWKTRGGLVPAPRELLEALRRPDPRPRERTETTIGAVQIGRCLEQLDPADFRNYDDWRNLLFAVNEACAGDHDGLEVFTEWSTSDPPYADAGANIRDFWEAADDRDEGRTAATLFWHVVQAGGAIPAGPAADDFDEVPDEPSDGTYEPKWQRVPKTGKVKATLAHNVREALRVFGVPLTINTFVEEIMHDGNLIDDAVASGYRMMISERWGQKWTGDVPKQALRDGIQWYANEHRIHPIRDYLNSLAWDGEPRLDAWLVEATRAEDTPYTRAVGHTLIYAAVGRVFHPGVKYDLMVILEGPQGVGKSMLVRRLGGEWTLEGLPPLHGPNDKDVIAAMLGCWFIEVEELASMRKADVDVLKSFITKTEDKVRMPYKEYPKTYRRQSVLVGTTNDAAYLRDSTGNRRFAPVHVGNQIDLERIDRDQLFAEATAEWKSNPRNPITLPPKIWAHAAIEQEKRRVEDPWEEIIEAAFEKIDEGELITSQSLFELLNIPFERARQFEQKRLSRVMQVLGWDKAKTSTHRGYRRITPRR